MMMKVFLAAACAAATGVNAVLEEGRVYADNAATDASVAQIRDTLANLLKSVEDEGREGESFFKKRQQWCSAGLRSNSASLRRADADLSQLKADLKEHEAAVEEAEGTVQQIQADIALAEHAINQSNWMLQAAQSNSTSFLQEEGDETLLRALVDNKKQTLASLQGEMEAILPALAGLQENIAETKRQITDRGDSVATGRSFLTMLKDDCDRGQRRADMASAARVEEANSIGAAMQVLEAVSGVAPHPRAQAQAPLSFAQWGRGTISAEDVFSLMGTQQRAARPRRHTLAADEEALQVRPAPARQAPPVPSAQPQIRALLTQLRGGSGGSSAQQAWCAAERERNEAQLSLAQDAVDRTQVEISTHADAETQLSALVTALDEETKALEGIGAQSQALTVRERTVAKSATKDHKLATRILAQAIAILSDLEVSGGVAGRKKKAVASAIDALKPAKAQFEAQLQSAVESDNEVAATAKRTADTAKAAGEARRREGVNVELARDRHSSRRAQGAESVRASQAQAKSSSEYLAELSKECSMDTANEQEQQRRAQMRALEDAQKVLDGRRLVVDGGDPYGVHMHAASAANQNLSPMERAAEEMGVSTDGDSQ